MMVVYSILAFVLSLFMMSCGKSDVLGVDVKTLSSQGPPTNTQDAASGPVMVSIAQGSTGKGPAAYGTNPLVVPVGAVVVWSNNDNENHTVTSSTGKFDSGPLAPGRVFAYTFVTPGTYPYYCSIHGQSSMSGVVQVQ